MLAAYWSDAASTLIRSRSGARAGGDVGDQPATYLQISLMVFVTLWMGFAVYMLIVETLPQENWLQARIPNYNSSHFTFVAYIFVIIQCLIGGWFLITTRATILVKRVKNILEPKGSSENAEAATQRSPSKQKSLGNQALVTKASDPNMQGSEALDDDIESFTEMVLRGLMSRIQLSGWIMFMQSILAGATLSMIFHPWGFIIWNILSSTLGIINSWVIIRSFKADRVPDGPFMKALLWMMNALHHNRDVMSPQEVLDALLNKEAGVLDKRDEQGRTFLFKAETPEMVHALLEAGADPDIRDNDGKKAEEVLSKGLRKAIMEHTRFADRFLINGLKQGAFGAKYHQSNSAIFSATDHSRQDTKVMLKFIEDKEFFHNEVDCRDKFKGVMNDDLVVPIEWKATVQDKNFDKSRKHPKFDRIRQYRYAIAMPASERNLAIVMLLEHVDLNVAWTVLARVAMALEHLHELKLIHGNVKPMNIERFADGTWKLNNLGTCVEGEFSACSRSLFCTSKRALACARLVHLKV